MSKIIVFDFDKTLIPIHLHNKLAQAIIAVKQKGQQLKYQNLISVLRKNLLKDFDNFILQWKPKLEAYYRAGYKLTITSHTAYGQFILDYLENFLKLDKKLIKNIDISAHSHRQWPIKKTTLNVFLFSKSGINISYAADSTSCALRATCLSLPIDEQSFYLAMRFLQCVKLTEENKFILQTTLTKDDRIWIKEKESQAIPIGVICPR